MADDPVLRNVLAALNRARLSTDRLAETAGIELGRLEQILHGEAPLLVVDATRIASALRMTAAALFASPPAISAPTPERLAYSLPAFAEAVTLSVDTVRQAIVSGDLTVRYPTSAGRKTIITREDGLLWLAQIRRNR